MNRLKLKLILVIALLAVVSFAAPKFSEVWASKLQLTPATDTVGVGKNLSVDVVVSGSSELVDGLDALVTYDPNFLQLKEIKDGTFFSTYPVKSDDGNGKITITALAPKEGVTLLGDITVATLDFEILDTGDTKLGITFDKDSTKDSNVPLHGTSLDSLTAAVGGDYNVTATPENAKKAQAKKTSGQPSALIIFIIILILIAIGIWYWLRHRKPKEDFYTPEPFPMDRPPTV